MANDLSKAEYWRNFILTRCRYPAIDRLRAQLVNATFHDFCPCGCNSFALIHKADALPPPIAEAGRRGGMVFEANFHLADEKTLEILLFTDEGGRLSYVEIDCVGNNFPVPDIMEINDEPFNVWASDRLLE